MKAKTINQINGRVKNLPTVQYYLNLCSDESRYNSNNYRSRYFNCPDGHSRTLSGNWIYARALKEMKAATGTTMYEDRRSVLIDLEYLREIQVTLEVNFYGVSFTYNNYSNLKALPQGFSRVQIRSNETLENFDLKQYAEKYFRQFIPAGIIGRIMLHLNKTRQEAKEIYIQAKYSQPIEERPNPQVNEYNALLKALKRVNILTDGLETLPTLRKAWREYKDKPATPYKRHLQKFDPFAMLDEISGEFDEEDDQINEAQSILNNPKIAWI